MVFLECRIWICAGYVLNLPLLCSEPGTIADFFNAKYCFHFVECLIREHRVVHCLQTSNKYDQTPAWKASDVVAMRSKK